MLLLVFIQFGEEEVWICEEFVFIFELGFIVGIFDRCVECICEYQDCGVGYFFFMILYVVKFDYLYIIGSDIILWVKIEVMIL